MSVSSQATPRALPLDLPDMTLPYYVRLSTMCPPDETTCNKYEPSAYCVHVCVLGSGQIPRYRRPALWFPVAHCPLEGDGGILQSSCHLVGRDKCNIEVESAGGGKDEF